MGTPDLPIGGPLFGASLLQVAEGSLQFLGCSKGEQMGGGWLCSPWSLEGGSDFGAPSESSAAHLYLCSSQCLFCTNVAYAPSIVLRHLPEEAHSCLLCVLFGEVMSCNS